VKLDIAVFIRLDCAAKDRRVGGVANGDEQARAVQGAGFARDNIL